MTAALDLSDADLAILRAVLEQHLPNGARVFVFGSRAHGGARQYSDLDLALAWDQPLGLELIGSIAEALSESDLPYKVDLVDLSTVDPSFRDRIARQCVALPLDTGSVITPARNL
ncbi:MAG TPA: nucleotidyltransferase domain-containing protein [Acetobacteraceae bacterium]|nr:nucleotidyltransferase domain-containing protein [Acetobacteraceae bacterium]